MSNNRRFQGNWCIGNGDYEVNHGNMRWWGILQRRIGDSRIGELGIDHNTKGLERCYFLHTKNTYLTPLTYLVLTSHSRLRVALIAGAKLRFDSSLWHVVLSTTSIF